MAAATATDVQKAYLAYFGRPADPVGLAYWTGKDTTTMKAGFAASAEYTALYSGMNSSQMVAQVYTNLLGRTAEAAGLLYWSGELAAGRQTVSSLVDSMQANALGADITTINNRVTYATSFTAALDTTAEIVGYSGTAAASAARTAIASVVDTAASLTAAQTALTTSVSTITAAGSASAGTTFTLTTGVDSGTAFTGSSGNDTFNSIHSGASTFNAFDTISGGEGTDILNIYATAYTSGDSIDVATVSGIETVNFRATDFATSIINVVASNFSGMTTFNDDRSTSSVAITGLASGTTVGFIGNGAVTNDALSAAYGASVTAGTLAISGGTTAGAVALNGAGLKTIAITSSGANNTTGAITSNTAVATAVTIAADKALTATGLTLAGAGTAVTLTVSGAATNVAATSTAAATGAVNLVALDTEFASVNAAGLTAGGVSATLSATVAATFTGGQGTDIITTSTSGQTGSIDAGAGTDTLVLANTVDINTTAEYAIYKNFETIQLNNAASLDLSLMTGSTFTGVAINEATGGVTATNLSATQAANVTLAMNGTATITLTGATVVATADTLNITTTDGDTTTSETVASGALTIAGVETINVTATDDLTLSSMAAVTGVTTLKISGPGDVNIVTGAHAVSANEAFNFSGVTGTTTLNFAAATGNAMGFTGGSGVDTVTDSAIGGNVITTGAGKDVISLTDKTSAGAATSIITGGAAADTISVLGAGSSSDVLKFVYAAGDSVSDSSQTNGISTSVTDNIINLDGSVLTTSGGSSVTFDTEVSATTFTFATASVTFGTSTVTNANDFYIVSHGATAVTIYQDTDGDKIIENGEFAVSLTGIVNSGFATGEFSVASGNLVITSA